MCFQLKEIPQTNSLLVQMQYKCLVLYKFLDPKWKDYPKMFFKNEGCKVIANTHQAPEHRFHPGI